MACILYSSSVSRQFAELYIGCELVVKITLYKSSDLAEYLKKKDTVQKDQVLPSTSPCRAA